MDNEAIIKHITKELSTHTIIYGEIKDNKSYNRFLRMLFLNSQLCRNDREKSFGVSIEDLQIEKEQLMTQVHNLKIDNFTL